jgi:hypothetical protein
LSQFPLIHVQGWSDIKYICGTIGHEITEGIADIDTLHSGGTIGDFEGRTIKEPFSNPTGNNELCDYCNKFGAENQTGGSGIGGQGAPQGGFLQHYTGIAT